jgi:thioredoxin-like negative regulator of GroEL
MRGGGRDDARRALEAVVARDPDGARGEAALLDLARLELAAGDAAAAYRHLARLPDPARDPGLAEGAHHLRCRVAVKLGDDAEATTCLQAFRRSYPRSPHDAESLALLAGITRTCAAARPLLEEYQRAYPRGPFADDARARLNACAGRDDR